MNPVSIGGKKDEFKATRTRKNYLVSIYLLWSN